jgi:hypothetical protein
MKSEKKFEYRMMIGDLPYLVGSQILCSTHDDLGKGEIVANFGNWLLSDVKLDYGMLIAGYENGLIGIVVLP